MHTHTVMQVVVINDPFGTGTVWTMACVVLPLCTRSKFTLMSKDYEAQLGKLLGPEDIPTCYGGEVPFNWTAHKPVALPRIASQDSNRHA